ncbi:MAG TPA: penicillin-binding protein 2 [Dehalococcoidia bacterium]|nr:penicillin-binding protein 2 [Dehalococcoidia bacterium]
MSSYFEGRRRWRAKEPKKERTAQGRIATMSAALKALVILMFGILVIQLVHLQVIKGEEYKEQAEINALREIPIPANRGLIYDRNGQLLVQNAARFSATIIPGDLPDSGVAGVYRMVSDVVQVPPEEIEAAVAEGIENQGEFTQVVVKTDLEREVALQLMELEPHVPGLRVQVEPARTYLSGDLLPHILGYIGPISAEEYEALGDDGYLFTDYLGKSGVELSYEDILRGKPGKKLVEVDAFGRELNVLSERRPIDGTNLVLTIDLSLQQRVTEILDEYTEEGENSAAAVIDVRTGELLSMVSLPTFDNNVFSGPLTPEDLSALVDAPGKPLVNHAISDRYPPGSTFKTIVGAAALQEGVASPSTTIVSRGYINVENEFDPNVVYVYKDWAPLGALDFYDGIAMSSNVYFYYLAGGKSDEGFRGLGEDKVADYARSFGLGSVTGVDIPGESDGLVPDADWKDETLNEPWTVGDTYNFGIGQGYVAATPLQMLRAVTAMANGGTLVTPHVVKEYQDSLGNTLQTVTTPTASVPVDEAYLQVLRAGMRQSVTSGVARNSAVNGVSVAGKTGTAEYGTIRPDGTYQTHGWFGGFAPAEDPQIAVIVFTEDGTGSNDASPVAARIFDHYFNGGGPVYDPSTPLPGTDEPQPTPNADATPGATDAPTDEPEPTDVAAPTDPPVVEPEPTVEPEPVPEPTEAPTDPPVEPTEPPPQDEAAEVASLPALRWLREAWS